MTKHYNNNNNNNNMIIAILKSILTSLWESVSIGISKYKLIKKFPTLKLYGKVQISNSIFGKYNLVLNSSITDSFIDDYSYISRDSSIRLCKVGKFTCIGPNVKIGLGTHPTNEFISVHPIFYSTAAQVGITFSDKNYFQERHKTYIGNDVWIGANVIIKGGVQIGDGAIIASGAVVSKDIAPYSIVGGIPAKLIKMRFSEVEITKLLKLKWWENDEEWLKNNFKIFHSIKNIDQIG